MGSSIIIQIRKLSGMLLILSFQIIFHVQQLVYISSLPLRNTFLLNADLSLSIDLAISPSISLYLLSLPCVVT